MLLNFFGLGRKAKYYQRETLKSEQNLIGVPKNS